MEFSSMRRGGSVARRTLAALVCLVASGGTVATADEWWNPADQAGSDSVLVSPESTPSQGSFDGMLSDQYSAAPVRPIAQDQVGLSPGPDAGVVDPDLEESEELDDDTFEDKLNAFAERLDSLDEGFEGLEEALDEVDGKASNKSLVVSGSSKSTMKISGRVHVDAWGFDTDDDPAMNQFSAGPEDELNRLGFRRLRFGVAGKVKDNMVYKIEMEFANGNNSEFRDAYLGWSDLPFLQKVLVGNQKRPYGLDHLNSSRYNVFIERPYVIEAFNEDARRLGVQSYGVSDDEAWNWRYGVFNQRNVQDEGNYTGDHLQLQVAGRLANTIWYDETSNGRGYAHWAISGTHADVSTEDNAESRFRTRPEARTSGTRWLDTGQIDGTDYYNLLGLEGVVNLGSLQIVGEYQSNWIERDGFEDLRLDGGYVYASYFLTGEHMPWSRSSGTLGRPVPLENFWLVDRCNGCRSAGWGAWQLAARYSVADFSDGADPEFYGGEGQAFTAAMNWYWNANARMQFNYITGEIENSTVGDRAGAPVAGNYNIYGARFMIDF
ncbi:OprO/OprP family phosphate-selective porin [Rhodopirellula europaea]